MLFWILRGLQVQVWCYRCSIMRSNKRIGLLKMDINNPFEFPVIKQAGVLCTSVILVLFLLETGEFILFFARFFFFFSCTVVSLFCARRKSLQTALICLLHLDFRVWQLANVTALICGVCSYYSCMAQSRTKMTKMVYKSEGCSPEPLTRKSQKIFLQLAKLPKEKTKDSCCGTSKWTDCEELERRAASVDKFSGSVLLPVPNFSSRITV